MQDLGNIEKLIQQLEEEKENKNSSFLFSHINKTILLLQSMTNNISNPGNFVDITEDIKTIIYWSIDSWSWENQLTKDIFETIEFYDKLMNKQTKDIEPKDSNLKLENIKNVFK